MPIELKDLTHVYMEGSPFQSVAVKNVTLLIQKGELIGVIGHTGSGKSTLIQHFNGLLKPNSGTIFVDGMDLNDKKTDLRKVRQSVGMVFQYPEYQLFEETVRLDIAFGPKNLGLSPDEVELRVLSACQSVGLKEELLEKSPFELSGGQKRRVAIAGVIAMRPETLVLDEPAAGLDPSGRRDMLSLLKSLHGEGHMTLIMVSHSMTDVARLCERVLVMNKGELVMDGTPAEIFARGDELTLMGLGLPRGAELCRALFKAGFPIKENLWRMEDVEAAILNVLRGGKAHG